MMRLFLQRNSRCWAPLNATNFLGHNSSFWHGHRTFPMRISSEHKVKARQIWNSKPFRSMFDKSCAIPWTYTGISATGRVKGKAMIDHHILFLCRSCLSVANFFSSASTLDCLRNRPGNKTSTFSFPLSSALCLFALRGGIVFKPHSSKGMRRRMTFPYWVIFLFHAVSDFSNSAQISLALAVARSTREGLACRPSLAVRWQ